MTLKELLEAIGNTPLEKLGEAWISAWITIGVTFVVIYGATAFYITRRSRH